MEMELVRHIEKELGLDYIVFHNRQFEKARNGLISYNDINWGKEEYFKFLKEEKIKYEQNKILKEKELILKEKELIVMNLPFDISKLDDSKFKNELQETYKLYLDYYLDTFENSDFKFNLLNFIVEEKINTDKSKLLDNFNYVLNLHCNDNNITTKDIKNEDIKYVIIYFCSYNLDSRVKEYIDNKLYKNNEEKESIEKFNNKDDYVKFIKNNIYDFNNNEFYKNHELNKYIDKKYIKENENILKTITKKNKMKI